jgi:hypothetical protein
MRFRTAPARATIAAMKHLLAFALLALTSAALGSPARAGGVSEVSVSVKGGSLRLVGDDGPSSVLIRATAQPGSFVVAGMAGTNINGGSGDNFSGVTRGFRIDLGGGNNELLITAGELVTELEVPGTFSYRSGSGSDLVVFDHVVFTGKVAIDPGEGDDTVVGYVCFLPSSARVSTGEGDDLVVLDNALTGGGLVLSLGLGDDEALLLDGNFAGRTSLLLGEGDDVARFHAVSFAALLLKGSTGSDAAVRTDAFDVTVTKESGMESTAIHPDPAQVTADVVGRPSVERALELIEEIGTGPS